MQGDRHNKGKPGFHLLPLDALQEICSVYDFGANKYAPWNWAKGLSWSDTQASLLRHLAAWSIGEERDSESGLPHDVHIAWNAITLVAMRIRGIGKDDRFKLISKGNDVTRHTVEGNISDPIVPVAGTYDPIARSTGHDVTNMMRPNDYSTNSGSGGSTVVNPVPRHIIAST